jgi:tryptophan synthase alpha chain
MSCLHNLFGAPEKKSVLMPYLTAGDPDLEHTLQLMRVMAARGVAAIELGVPFSDPVADGFTIQKAMARALARQVHLDQILEVVSRFRVEANTPVILLTYYNPVFVYGLNRFARRARSAGVDGVIVPDLPPEESGPLQQACTLTGLNQIFLLAPTSTPERIGKVAETDSSFVYFVSVTGVTGTRAELPQELRDQVTRVRELTGKPVVVGFGISTPAQARAVGTFADGVIVGSAIVQFIEQHVGDPSLTELVGELVGTFQQALGM